MNEAEIRFFDGIAPYWDATETMSLPDKINSILDMIEIEEGSRVLDLGTGTGVLIPYLLERVGEKGRVLGIDFSEGMLREARKKFGTLANYELFECKDFEHETIEGKYNLIMLYCVYPHIKDPIITLKKLINDNLQPGGRLVIAFPANEEVINNIHKEKKAPSDLLPSSAQLARNLCALGFNACSIESDSDRYLVIVDSPVREH